MAAPIRSLCTICCAVVVSSIFGADLVYADIIVETTLGAIGGKLQYSTLNSKPVYSFLGIKYAEVRGRFKPPSPVVQWSGVLDATRFKPHCVHNVQYGKERLSRLGLTYSHDDVSEDCLYLNVYSPSLSAPGPAGDPFDDILYGTAPYPVVVYIHGGNFVMWSGSTVSPLALVAEEKVVVVTLNYRLGPFGFLCVGKAANLGLLDQIEALNWVRNNIRSFNGNPQKVTLMGFSAGASSVGLHLLSPLSRGLFRRAVIMGGSSLSVKAVTSYGHVAARELARAVNCSADASPNTLLGCLRKVDAHVLARHRPASAHDTFRPCVDGRVVPKHPQLLYRDGIISDGIQVLTGFTELEAFGWVAEETEGDYDESDFNETLRSWFRGSRDFSDTTVKKLVAETRRAYIEGSGLSASDEGEDDESASRRANAASVYRAAAADILSDYLIAAPTIKVAQLHCDHGADVFVYLFTYTASYHARSRRPAYFSSTHGEDMVPALGLVFDKSFRLQPVLNDDEQLSKRMMSYVGCFARSGNPNSPTLQGHTWPRFASSTRQYLRVTDARNCHPYGLLKPGLQPFWDSYLFGAVGVPGSAGNDEEASESNAPVQPSPHNVEVGTLTDRTEELGSHNDDALSVKEGDIDSSQATLTVESSVDHSRSSNDVAAELSRYADVSNTHPADSEFASESDDAAESSNGERLGNGETLASTDTFDDHAVLSDHKPQEEADSLSYKDEL